MDGLHRIRIFLIRCRATQVLEMSGHPTTGEQSLTVSIPGIESVIKHKPFTSCSSSRHTNSCYCIFINVNIPNKCMSVPIYIEVLIPFDISYYVIIILYHYAMFHCFPRGIFSYECWIHVLSYLMCWLLMIIVNFDFVNVKAKYSQH